MAAGQFGHFKLEVTMVGAHGTDGEPRQVDGQLLLFATGDGDATNNGCDALPHGRSRSGRKRSSAGANANGAVDAETAKVAATMLEIVQRLDERFGRLEAALAALRNELTAKATVKEFYATAEVAKILGKRPYTVREWCRLGRVRGEKTHSGRGLDDEWRIPHDELVRIQNEGLLPIERFAKIEPPKRLVR
jgi:hypothetical protein